MAERKSGAAFSARVDKDTVNIWRTYAKVSGMTLTHMTIEAMNEYMAAHPLTGFKANIFNALTEVKNMTVREWIEDQASKALYAEEEQHGRHFAEDTKQAYINKFVDESVDAWKGADDPLADDKATSWWRDRVIDYAEEWAENLVEHLGAMEDEQ